MDYQDDDDVGRNIWSSSNDPTPPELSGFSSFPSLGTLRSGPHTQPHSDDEEHIGFGRQDPFEPGGVPTEQQQADVPGQDDFMGASRDDALQLPGLASDHSRSSVSLSSATTDEDDFAEAPESHEVSSYVHAESMERHNTVAPISTTPLVLAHSPASDRTSLDTVQPSLTRLSIEPSSATQDDFDDFGDFGAGNDGAQDDDDFGDFDEVPVSAASIRRPPSFSEMDGGFESFRPVASASRVMDSFASPTDPSAWSASSHTRPSVTPLDLTKATSVEELAGPIQAILSVVFPEETLPPLADAPNRSREGSEILISEESRELYAQLSRPPLGPPLDWKRSRIRRDFFIALGIPINLDEMTQPAQKPVATLILPSERPATQGKAGSKRTVLSPEALVASTLRRDRAQTLLSLTPEHLNRLDATKLKSHRNELCRLSENASEALTKLLEARESLQVDEVTYNSMIQDLVTTAQKVKLPSSTKRGSGRASPRSFFGKDRPSSPAPPDLHSASVSRQASMQ
ncbi:uncharacterized protein L969DRAFT_136156 [Mixia osmundae IAM 14324]|uniref:Uncharacterized protein n=1 Tax=Mixia osmundae (strain CBS 9802 / IAM 14324 / JCM 22182 / KY 12970) TaxID=764103 RepID=G7E062_MIXOS|nr:uncharacterized protein L969DRAFT_136156 [Mixia osmundae IAM 14324]KEI42212.1 hypothetical protein L969DRAFT_136156 [Mixia osmundae IAM 14324]GAA96222.1 hypothetical protein E5Q_02886 [Mixia osmundae IAM 14324]